jgi:hypothetical protein
MFTGDRQQLRPVRTAIVQTSDGGWRGNNPLGANPGYLCQTQPSTRAWTITGTSCPAWATPETGCSGRSSRGAGTSSEYELKGSVILCDETLGGNETERKEFDAAQL